MAIAHRKAPLYWKSPRDRARRPLHLPPPAPDPGLIEDVPVPGVHTRRFNPTKHGARLAAFSTEDSICEA
jgi:hypothetical protein